jgi:hypothetical protein
MKKKIEQVDLGSHGTFPVHKGKLHEALGLSPDTPISDERLKEAEHSKKPSIRSMARSAEGFRHMNHSK